MALGPRASGSILAQETTVIEGEGPTFPIFSSKVSWEAGAAPPETVGESKRGRPDGATEPFSKP